MIAPSAKLIDWDTLQVAAVIESLNRKLLIFGIIFLTTLLPAFPFSDAAETGGDWPKTIPELQAAIEGVLKATRTPGAGIAIVSRDKAEWVAGIGKADVAANKPATDETLFRIASTGKALLPWLRSNCRRKTNSNFWTPSANGCRTSLSPINGRQPTR